MITDFKTLQACQGCGSSNLAAVLSLGTVPPVNRMARCEDGPQPHMRYPLSLVRCENCDLVQLGQVVDPSIVFPADYPYTSGSTAALCANFEDLRREAIDLDLVGPGDLVVDVGSNDGTLLRCFRDAGCQVLGIEPTDVADVANERGIPTVKQRLERRVAIDVRKTHGVAKLVAMTNCFAHVEDVHDVIDSVRYQLLAGGGIGTFVTESHYLPSLLDSGQYDAIYHEHLRYYSLRSLQTLFAAHNMEIFRTKFIPTHGGSIRVYATRQGYRRIDHDVEKMILLESAGDDLTNQLRSFVELVKRTKLDLLEMLCAEKIKGKQIVGIGAPSRASTLISYVGIDRTMLDYVCETPGSLKIGRYMPGTEIPVVDEARLYEEQPDFALLLAWHLADELIEKIRAKGYRGEFIVPLPVPVLR